MFSDQHQRTARTTGAGERMPGICFRMMSAMFWLRDRIRPPDLILNSMGIHEGMTVVDYGCGPGSYLKRASELVGDAGTVYAVDIHELAIASVSKRISREELGNVIPVLARGYESGLGAETADLVYALDMFHMVEDPHAFLTELRRIAKPDATLIIDDGHQPRERTRSLIQRSTCWVIEEEKPEFLRCQPEQGNSPEKCPAVSS